MVDQNQSKCSIRKRVNRSNNTIHDKSSARKKTHKSQNKSISYSANRCACMPQNILHNHNSIYRKVFPCNLQSHQSGAQCEACSRQSHNVRKTHGGRSALRAGVVGRRRVITNDGESVRVELGRINRSRGRILGCGLGGTGRCHSTVRCLWVCSTTDIVLAALGGASVIGAVAFRNAILAVENAEVVGNCLGNSEAMLAMHHAVLKLAVGSLCQIGRGAVGTDALVK